MASKQNNPTDNRISRVELQHWRGATCTHAIDFDPKKQVVLIYGENGTGKSSILDGIEFALSGRIGSLEFLSLDGATKESHLVTLGHAKSKSSATVKIGSNKYIGKPGSRRQEVLAPKVFAIRRGSLKKLTESTPQDRYTLIAPCFEVDNVRKCEDELANAIRDYERRSDTANTKTTTSLQELHNQNKLTKPTEPVTDAIVLAWAVATSGRDLSADTSKKEILDRVIQKAPAFFMRAKDLIDACAALSQATVSQKAIEQPAQVGGPSRQEQDLEKVLEPGKAYIQVHQPAHCPICEREDSPEDRVAKLTTRLVALSSSKTVNQQRVTATTKVKTAETQFNEAITKLQEAIIALLPDLRDAKDELVDRVESFVGVENFTVEQLDGLQSLVDARETHETRIKARRDKVADKISKIRSLAVTLQTYNENKDQSATYVEITKRLAKSLDVIRTMRKAFIQAELDAISGDVSKMYQFLHPSEQYVPGAIALLENKKGSLVHKAKLGDIETTPNATFSESHIDTLALCVQLALAKRVGGPNCILILDDVYHSVDNQHLDRMIDLLMDQSQNFAQVVMATHYLRAAKRFSMNRVGSGSVHQIVLFSKWSLGRGLQWKDQPLECDVLDAMLHSQPIDRQSVASKTGVLMEAVLDTLVCNYRCKVPKSSDGENTLAELRDGFSRVAKLMSKQEGEFEDGVWTKTCLPVALESPWREFEECFGVRNDVGAHWKEVGQDEPDANVEFFARSALAVIEVVTCSQCRSLPRRRDGSFWTCTCKRSRFSPLESR